ncbi:MAG: hypothetical protein K0Q66_1673 [Chitinophagaceae bacterium]|jgi:hypothetical protein|nr:hypothetical protein [Chitinophagaceae bacterium]
MRKAGESDRLLDKVIAQNGVVQPERSYPAGLSNEY